MKQRTKIDIATTGINTEYTNDIALKAVSDKAKGTLKKLKSKFSYRGFKSAKKLKLTDIQRRALINTLKLMEAGEIRHARFPDKTKREKTGLLFNMENWKENYECGTVCCIGGTAEFLAKAPIFRNRDYSGIKNNDLHELFCGGGVMSSVTPRQAAKALRNYLKTGVTDWGKAGINYLD